MQGAQIGVGGLNPHGPPHFNHRGQPGKAQPPGAILQCLQLHIVAYLFVLRLKDNRLTKRVAYASGSQAGKDQEDDRTEDGRTVLKRICGEQV